MEAVIAAFIAAAASIACQLIIARSGAKENKKSQEATERLIIYRIDRLEQTVPSITHSFQEWRQRNKR